MDTGVAESLPGSPPNRRFIPAKQGLEPLVKTPGTLEPGIRLEESRERFLYSRVVPLGQLFTNGRRRVIRAGNRRCRWNSTEKQGQPRMALS